MKRFWILVLCLSLLLLSACGTVGDTDDAISGLVLGPSCKQDECLEVGESTEGYFTVITMSEVFFWDIEFVSTDESVVTVQYEKTAGDIYVYFTIKAVAAGEAEVYFTADGGKVESDRIRVTVVETDSDETKTENEVAGDDRVVYVTKSGTKYHYSKDCAGQNAVETRLSEASLTKQPCKTCASEKDGEETTETAESDTTGPEETTAPDNEDNTSNEGTNETTDSRIVYVTPSGKRYHDSQNCAGKNAKETTIDEAIAAGKTACGTCAKK